MTGFGKVTAELPSKKVTIEIKALNSKQLDLSTRVPSLYKEKEMEIRSLLLQTLERGKVDFSIYLEYIGKEKIQEAVRKKPSISVRSHRAAGLFLRREFMFPWVLISEERALKSLL